EAEHRRADADSEAVDGGEQWLRELDQLIEIAGEAVATDGQLTRVALGPLDEVGTAGERRAGTRDDDDRDAVVGSRVDQCFGGGVVERFVERVPRLWAIERGRD